MLTVRRAQMAAFREPMTTAQICRLQEQLRQRHAAACAGLDDASLLAFARAAVESAHAARCYADASVFPFSMARFVERFVDSAPRAAVAVTVPPPTGS